MNELLTHRIPPNNNNELFERLRQICKMGWQEMPSNNRRYNGTGGPGNYLEDLIGLTAGNKDIADIVGWELKYYTLKTSLITLFHKEPEPKGVLRYMVSQYGWIDAHNRRSFRHTIRGRSDRFEVVNDAGNIIVRPLENSDDSVVPIWSHDTLLNIAGGKLRRLITVRGERNGIKVRFNRVDRFEDLFLTRLIEYIKNGTIAIDFDVREKMAGSDALRNHGTKFRIPPENIKGIYKKHDRVV